MLNLRLVNLFFKELALAASIFKYLCFSLSELFVLLQFMPSQDFDSDVSIDNLELDWVGNNVGGEGSLSTG